MPRDLGNQSSFCEGVDVFELIWGQSRSKRQLIGIGYCLDLQRYSDYHDRLIASSSRFLHQHDKLLNLIGRDASRFPKEPSLGYFERVIADGYRLGATNVIPISRIKNHVGSPRKIKPKMAEKIGKKPGTSVWVKNGIAKAVRKISSNTQMNTATTRKPMLKPGSGISICKLDPS